MGYLMTAQNNIAEEVAWIVGDEAIYKSDIEEQYQQLQYERTPIDGNPYCVIPEQIAIDKLFLHQAKIDTIEVPNSTVQQSVDARINYFIANLGSKEKVEEYFRKPIPEIREQLMNTVRDQYTIQQVQSSLTKNVKATPSDVRKFYNSIPKDSLPLIQKQVEVEIITINPIIPQQEIDEVKSRLRDYAQRVNNGESDFSTLALLYSEDGPQTHTTLFEMADLPDEIGKVVDKLQVGEISEPFIAINKSNNRQQVAMVKLVRRIEAHKADLAEDFQVLKDMYENKRKAEIIDEWVKEKQKKTYVHISEGWRNCEFKYNWRKQ